MKKLCKRCGKEFETKTKQQYCQECLTGYDPCPICGKQKPVLLKFCSQTCVCKWQRSQPGYKNPFSELGFNKKIEDKKIEEFGSREKYYQHRTKKTRETLLANPKPRVSTPARCEANRLITEKRREKYGGLYYVQTEEFKQKSRKTMLEKYGVDNPNKSSEIRAKTRATCEERYGGPAPSCDKEICQRMLDTHQKNNGGIGMGSKKIRKKILSTLNKNYGTVGVTNISQLSEVLETKRRSAMERYGVVHASQRNYPDYIKPATYDDNYLLSLVEGLETYEELYTKYGDDANIINYLLPNDRKLIRRNSVEWFGWSGEVKTASFLDKNNIDFIHEYTFSDLKDVGRLRFDFGLLNDNKLLCLIEFQGQQHYEPSKMFGGKDTFNIQIHHDQMKRDYCKEHNIPLIEIPYWEEPRLEEFLTEELIKLNILDRKE